MRKTRPAVIVSNDVANRHSARAVVVSLTSSTQRQYLGEAVLAVADKSSKTMADQIMAADKPRLRDRLDALSKADMLAVEDAIKLQLGLLR